MFSYRMRMLRLFGFDVYVEASWVIVAVLVTWSLAIGLFPATAPGLSPSTYLAMAVAGAAGLFASIVLHEMTHSLVARRYDMPIQGITLFIFGGVAEMADEPTSPRGEFLMALAGPVASLALALLFLAGGAAAQAAAPAAAVLGYLGAINMVLALFNLIPAFPLDGGRMLRAVLWGWRKDIIWASRIASAAGEALAILMIGLGLAQVFTGALLNGLWLGLIGLFLHGAAGFSYRQVVARQALKGEPVERFMTREPLAAPPTISIQTLVDDYVYRHHHKSFPVVRDGEVVGCVSVADIGSVDRARWTEVAVADLMRPCAEQTVAAPQTDALEALRKMQQSGGGPLLVTDRGRLVGILSLRDLMGFLALKLELERPRPDVLRAAPALNGPA